MDAPVLRWGILGPGWIAEQFVESLQAHTRQDVVAVGSRSLDRAQAFAAPPMAAPIIAPANQSNQGGDPSYGQTSATPHDPTSPPSAAFTKRQEPGAKRRSGRALPFSYAAKIGPA